MPNQRFVKLALLSCNRPIIHLVKLDTLFVPQKWQIEIQPTW